MDPGVTFGAGKAGGAFDPMSFLARPQVVLRLLCWLFSVILFGCISNKGWNEDGPRPVCIFNKDGNACRFGNMVGLVGFLAALVFLVLEGLFQQMSSLKIRRRVVGADLGFSACWTIANLLCFAYLLIQWSKSEYPVFGEGINNARSAVAFAFFNVPVWGGCAYFAHQRWASGTDMGQFASAFETAGAQVGADGYGYTDDPNAAAYAADPYAAAVEGDPNAGYAQAAAY